MAVPGFSISLAYYDTYRRENVPANLVQVGARISSPLMPMVHIRYMLKPIWHWQTASRVVAEDCSCGFAGTERLLWLAHL